MKIRDLDLSASPVNIQHQELGLPPLERHVTMANNHPLLRTAMWSVLLLMAGCIALLATRLMQQPNSLHGVAAVFQSEAFWWAVAVGLVAQAIDGVLGMAYGIDRLGQPGRAFPHLRHRRRFSLLMGEAPWPTVARLVVGGLFAAPLAARVTRCLHARTLLILVGAVIVTVSLFNLWRALA